MLYNSMLYNALECLLSCGADYAEYAETFIFRCN